jgi:O-antigen/teichoic acid export membrane protein
MTLLFSEKYAASAPVFAVLMIAFHVMVQINLMGYTLTSAGYPSRSLGINVARTVQTVLGSILLIPIAGFIGPAYARLIAYYTVSPISLSLVRRSGIAVAVMPYLKQVGVLVFCAALAWWMNPLPVSLRGAVLLVFLVLSFALSTVSRADLQLVLPKRIVNRMGI